MPTSVASIVVTTMNEMMAIRMSTATDDAPRTVSADLTSPSIGGLPPFDEVDGAALADPWW